jgi:DNA-binding PucR family transcriptional regulator
MHLPDFATAFRHDTRALDAACALGAIGVFDFEALGVQAAVVNDPDVGDVLIRRYVHSFASVTGGDAILGTVVWFFNNDFSVDTTARELGVHSNTIRQ